MKEEARKSKEEYFVKIMKVNDLFRSVPLS